MPLPIVFATPPAPGTTIPGDLYVDLQSRSLWLGVDPAVDTAEAVLISDIVALLAHDDATLLAAGAYTDTQILTRAPVNHTHTANQVTDFTPAVQAVVNTMPSANFTPGMWVGWAGKLTDIGVGDLAGWALCDGRSLSRTTYPELFAKISTLYGSVDSTHFNIPDMRDRFIIGGGNLSQGQKNTAANFNVAAEGAHSHTVGGWALTLAQLPSHSHGAGTYAFSDTTSSSGAHSHTYSRISESSGGTAGEGGNGLVETSTNTSTFAAHTHTVSGAVTGTSSTAGSGATHTHTLTNASDHTHAVTVAQVRAATPWYAQAYIIKL